MKPTAFFRAFFIGSSLLAAPLAQGTTLYWDVNGQTGGFSTVVGAWNTGAFWNTDATGGAGGSVTATTTFADDLNIVAATTNTGTITVTGTKNASSITFASGVGAVTISSGTIGIGGTGTLSGIFNNSASNQVVNSALSLNSSINLTNTAAGSLTIGGAITGTATTGNTQTITISSSSTGNITLGSGVIGDGVGGGKVALVINNTGAGATTLSGNNTFSGGVTLTAGTITNIGSGVYNGFGTGTLSLNGGTLALNAGATPIFNNNANWSGTLNMTRASSGTPVVTWNGAITLTGNTTFTHGAATYAINQTVNGNIGDEGSGYSLTFSGGNTSSKPVYTLNGTNSYTGLTTLNNGTLVMTKPSSIGGLTVSGTQSFIYAPTAAGALNLGGAMTIGSATPIGAALGGTASQSVIAATGAASLSGTGKVDIRRTLGVTPAAGTHNLITAASGLTGGTYTLGTVFNNTDFTVSNFTRSATAISVDVASATALSGDVYWKGGLAGNTGVWSASNGSTTSNWQVTDGVNQALAPGATADLIFSTATSPGTMAGMTLGANMTVRSLTINNTATAFGLGNDILGSTLTIAPDSSTTGITMGSGVQAASISAPLILGAAQTWTNNSGNALTVNGSVNTNGNTLIIDGTGNVTFGNANSTITGSGGITMNGSGRLTLGGNPSPNHSFSGDLVLNGGVTMVGGTGVSNLGSGNLQLNGGVLEFYWTYTLDRTLGSGAGQMRIIGGESGFSENGSTGGQVTLNNSTSFVPVWGSEFFNPTKLILQTSAAQTSSTLTLNNGIDLNGATRTIVVNKNTNLTNTTQGAIIVRALVNNGGTPSGLTKEGVGLLRLQGANTFNGLTTISGGTLAIENALGLQNSAIDTTNSITGSATSGLRITNASLTLGGLVGNKNFADIFRTTDGGLGSLANLTLNPATSETRNYSGAIANGAANMNLIKSGSGTQILSGANTYSGTTTVNAGTLQFARMESLYNNTPTDWTAAKINVKNTATLALNVDSAGTAGFDSSNLDTLLTNISVANTATQGLQAGARLGIDTSTATGGTFTQGNAIADSTGSGSFHGAIGLTKLGAGTLVLDKTNTYTGATTVNGGALLINGSTSSTSLVTVNSGGTLGGTGTTGAITLNDGAFLSPGASIESLATGDNIWNGGSTFVFEFSTDGSTGTAGTEWDLLAITGELDLSGASIGNPINFDLITMADATTSGLLGTWNPNANAVWSGFVTTTGGITGFAANLFDIDITGFQNSLNGTFSVAQNGNNLDLIYTAVPEPRAALLGGLGMLLLLRRRRD